MVDDYIKNEKNVKISFKFFFDEVNHFLLFKLHQDIKLKKGCQAIKSSPVSYKRVDPDLAVVLEVAIKVVI